MLRRRKLVIVAALTVLGLLIGASAAGAGNDYSDLDFLSHDLDNVNRSLGQGRQLEYAIDLDYGYAFAPAAAETFLTNLGRQVGDLPHGRVYATLGQVLPGGAVGNPVSYPRQHPTTISFASRTGAKLVGRIWTDGKPGPHPAVVITPGSIQGTQHMYFWAAWALSKRGYQVLTFDAQGQGESETFGHAPGDPLPTGDGFPFQQAPNFIDGTVDALRFLYSTPADPYRPGGWTAADAQRADTGDPSLSWSNPAAATLDRSRVALAGHSLGAAAISIVQQCSDQAELWRRLPVCGGRSFPIKAVVAWDGLTADGVTPVVPAMDQSADGYFLNPAPTGMAPDPTSNLGGLRRWRAAGIDAYALTVRGGTHLEWVDVPYILPSTTYGVLMAERYTVAWIDRYLSPHQSVREQASAELADSPKRDRVTGGRDQNPWSASFMSARFLGGYTFHDARGGTRVVNDLRAYGGASPVGDWSGANSDRPRVRPTP